MLRGYKNRYFWARLVQYCKVDDEISGSENKDTYEHIHQAILDALDLSRIVRLHKQFHSLDDDDDQHDEWYYTKCIVDYLVEDRYVFARENSCTYLSEIRDILINHFILCAVDDFHNLFCSDDNEHRDDIPCNERSCFLHCVRIFTEDEGNDTSNEDDEHRS